MNLQDVHMNLRLVKLVKKALIIYVVKRATSSVSEKYAKGLYILLLSPTLLTYALLHHDKISYGYRKFLMSYTYPECKLEKDQAYEGCQQVHGEKGCTTSFNENCTVTITSTVRLYASMYAVIYFMDSMYDVVHSKYSSSFTRTKVKRVLFHVLRSSSFFISQCLAQRLLLCSFNKVQKKLRKKDVIDEFTPDKMELYILSALGSIPILLERSCRVKQINNLVISHILLGRWMYALRKAEREEKKTWVISSLPLQLFLAVAARDGNISFLPLLSAFITALTF
jgi:hypothetical protein